MQQQIPALVMTLVLFLSGILLSGAGLPGAVPVARAALPAVVDGQALPSLAPMIREVSPAVVNISTYAQVRYENPLWRDPFFRRFFSVPEPRQERQARSAGSGVIVDARKGYVVTNHHVIAQADTIEVTLSDGRNVQARLLGSDAQVDLALLQIEAENLTAIRVARSDSLQVGDFVVAIGNPFGLGQTVTSGIVSALGRSGLGILGYEDFIQTDASINPGNSGGALVNLRGELVGINSAIIAPAGGNVGIGFAIPISIVTQVQEQLARYGEVRRGMLGIAFQELTPELSEAFGLGQRRGVLVAQVAEDSAAEKAGLRQGDIIIGLDGRSVESGADLRNRLGLMAAGQETELRILRDGRERSLEVALDEQQIGRVTGGELAAGLDGIQFEDYRQDGQSVAVVVKRIDRGSQAWRQGVREGDLIVAVNRFRVTDTQDLQQAFQQSRAVVLQIQRGDQMFYLTLR